MSNIHKRIRFIKPMVHWYQWRPHLSPLTPMESICEYWTTLGKLSDLRCLMNALNTRRKWAKIPNTWWSSHRCSIRGGEWYLEKRGSRKVLLGSRNLESVFDQSQSLVFAWFVFTFFESQNSLPQSLGLRFLTRISASWQVWEFTTRNPFY